MHRQKKVFSSSHFAGAASAILTETKEINENIYIDLDASGNLVAMTIEHARQQASLPFLSFEQISETSENPIRHPA